VYPVSMKLVLYSGTVARKVERRGECRDACALLGLNLDRSSYLISTAKVHLHHNSCVALLIKRSVQSTVALSSRTLITILRPKGSKLFIPPPAFSSHVSLAEPRPS
jgi:hypothetical protein